MKKTAKVIIAVFYFVVAAAAIVFSLVSFTSYRYVGAYSVKIPYYKNYGGDAYTGIQNALVDNVKAIDSLVESIKGFFSVYYRFITIAFGLLFLLIAAIYLTKGLKTLLTAPLNVTASDSNNSSNQIPLQSNNEEMVIEIEKYRLLLTKGIITEEEFDAKRKQLLDL